MNQILEQLGTYGIVPVVVLQDAAKAEPLAEALCKGGLACAEVTFRTDAAGPPTPQIRSAYQKRDEYDVFIPLLTAAASGAGSSREEAP